MHIHVLKWMKSLFATATISSDIKYEINEIFKSFVYAKDEFDFNGKLEEWNKVVDQDVLVRLGTGEHAHYVSLADYYEKNWAPIRHMWAWCERKRLPIGEENTNNRLECAFRKLKEDLKMSNIGEVTIEVAVMSVVRWAELKLLDAVTQAQRKDIRIYEENPDLQLEYDNAVMELNETGVLAFRKSLELLKKFETKMFITEEGVIEKFSTKTTESNEDEVNEKIYRASETYCSCTKWHQSHFVCRHILFFRREKKLPLFQKNLFSEYFHRERYGDLDVKINENKECIEMNGDMEQIEDEDVEDNTFVLTPEEKFKISNDITSELRELFCHFGTEQFTTYMWELEVVKRRVRRGLSMISATAKVTNNKEMDVVNLDKGVQVENFEGEKFKFLEIIRKKGRPKYSGAGKLKFPKPKKRLLPSKKLSEESVVSDAITVTDTDVSVDQLDNWSEHICLAPPVPGQPSDNIITKFDYAHLAPKSYVTTTTINWWLSLLDKQYTLRASKNIRPVLVLCTEFYQKLEAWDLDTGMPDKNNGLQKWTESAQLWHGGSRIVILPLCWREHFYTLVAVLDNRQPMLYILESIGGHYANIPPYTDKFCSYLQLLREEQEGNGPGFKSMFLTVPRQKEGSNDCGMFCLKFIEMILENPDDFEIRARNNDFRHWFDIDTVDVKRKELVARIDQLAVEQRMPGGRILFVCREKKLPCTFIERSMVI